MTLLAATVASPASAHVTKVSGPFAVELGWGNEPALAGENNFIEVGVVDNSSGSPLIVPAGKLSVEVSYGDTAITLPLAPAEEGGLRAELIPTQPGVYTFHVTGSARGRTLDVRATCSEATFNCVEEAASVEFPVKEPSTAEVAQRISQESDRVNEATDTADSAETYAIAAIAIAGLAIIAMLAITRRGWRRRRKS